MGFHFNWQLPGSIRQSDKLMGGVWVFRDGGGYCEGALRMQPARWGGGGVSFPSTAFATVSLKFLWMGRSQRPTAPPCVCFWARRGRNACRSIDLGFSAKSLAFVCQIYLSLRLSFHCHSLTHSSDTSWALHRWENNTYLWPPELFSSSPKKKKGGFSGSRLF